MPEVDITNCDLEPIHIPGSIQPHGVLLVVDEADRIVQISENCSEHLGSNQLELLGKPLSAVIDSSGDSCTIAGKRFNISVRTVERGRIIELEHATAADAAAISRELNDAVREFRSAVGIRDLAQIAASRVRQLCEFDRVMIYQFQPDDTGVVIAESKADAVESYLGHHFPASDIPKQARALYVRNWTRLVADVSYKPSPIIPTLNPVTNESVDLSDCALRSVSPIHVQYLRNMGVRASMSISIVKDDKLWGLIACHHMKPWYGSRQLREACELLGEIVSLQIVSLEDRLSQRRFEGSRKILRQLTRAMADAESAGRGLVDQGVELLDLVQATGAAVIEGGRISLIGATPSTDEISRITAFIGDKCWKSPFAITSLASVFPEAKRYASTASGLLAICHSRADSNRVIWFRPEVVQTVTWAGNPEKPVDKVEGGLRPRASFKSWQETVRNAAKPWSAADLTIAYDLRVAILEAELTSMNSELERRVSERTSALQIAVDELNGFTYSVSHDLRTPLRGMVGNSRIILEEYGQEVSRPIRERLLSIEGNALKMANLVDDLLRFARLGRQDLSRQTTSLSSIARMCAERLESQGWPCEQLNVKIEDGMTASVDPNLIEMVFTILIENGCKYRNADQEPNVSIGKTIKKNLEVYFVENEGIGFEMQYADRLFRPFERLHRDGEFPGTGIGLANAKRIIERHGGQIWAEGRPGEGATFYFTL